MRLLEDWGSKRLSWKNGYCKKSSINSSVKAIGGILHTVKYGSKLKFELDGFMLHRQSYLLFTR